MKTKTVAWKKSGDCFGSGGSWTKVNHLVHEMTDTRVGSFPTLCGTWVPDGWDAEILDTSPKARGRTCRRCTAALNREEG